MIASEEIRSVANDAARQITVVAADAARELIVAARTASAELTTATQEVSGNMKALASEVRELSSSLREHIVRDDACRGRVNAMAADMWGVDGDPSKSGIKGRVREAERTIGEHSEQLETIKETYRGGLSRAWLAASGLFIACVGAIVGAWFKHLWP